MDPLSIRDELRAFLNSDQISLADVERDSGMTRSWLSKFRRGDIKNPRTDQLAELHRFRERFLARPVQ